MSVAGLVYFYATIDQAILYIPKFIEHLNG